MSTVELDRTYPIDRKLLFDHLTDPSIWPSYYNGMIEVEATGRFAEPGDTVVAKHRLLGRVVDVEVTLLEVTPPERIRLRAETAGVPPIEHDWRYHEAGEDATRIEVAMTSVEVDSWLGRKLDRFVMARQLEKDLRRSLDNIGDLVAFGWE
jgi:uncharacterized protein YndB with AHSA1/START domain